MPLGKDVSANMHELAHAKKKRPRDQMIAIALRAAGKSKKDKDSKRHEMREAKGELVDHKGTVDFSEMAHRMRKKRS